MAAHFPGPSQVIKLLGEKEILEGVVINFNEELGTGAYGRVYQAEWRGLSCVVKVFHASIFPNHPADTWKQLAREIELLQHMHHPNIVQLLGFIPDTESRIPSIAMERLNTNLTLLIKEHHSLLSFSTQVCILHDVAVGLSFLHGHKEPIVHRDLSSNNILLTDHLVAKISDLGLAKHIKSSEQQVGSYTGFGTQDYMPPEVLGQKPPEISPKTDVFSFGVVMLQVATGKPPNVRGRVNVDAEADRRKHHLNLLSENNLFYLLVSQCLCNNSYDRPTASTLCKALNKFGCVRKASLEQTTMIAQLQMQLQERNKQCQQIASSLEDAHQKQTDMQEESRYVMKRSEQLTEENAKLHEQNFSLMEDVKSLTAILQQRNDEYTVLKEENARLQNELKIQMKNAEKNKQTLNEKNYTIATELQKLCDDHLLEIEGLKEENAKQKTVIQTLQMQQVSYQSTCKGKEHKITALEEKSTSLQEQVDSLKQEKAMLSEQLRQLQQSAGIETGPTHTTVPKLETTV